MKELTKAQITRQDFVDNAIFEMLQKISNKPLKWDAEMFGQIKDIAHYWIVDVYGMDEQEFYPFVDE